MWEKRSFMVILGGGFDFFIVRCILYWGMVVRQMFIGSRGDGGKHDAKANPTHSSPWVSNIPSHPIPSHFSQHSKANPG